MKSRLKTLTCNQKRNMLVISSHIKWLSSMDEVMSETIFQEMGGRS